MTILVSTPSNTPIPDATIPPVDPTEEFKTIVSEITDALPYLISPISHEPETVLLLMEFLKQELIDSAATYKAAVPLPNKYLIL